MTAEAKPRAQGSLGLLPTPIVRLALILVLLAGVAKYVRSTILLQWGKVPGDLAASVAARRLLELMDSADEHPNSLRHSRAGGNPDSLGLAPSTGIRRKNGHRPSLDARLRGHDAPIRANGWPPSPPSPAV